MKTLYQAAALVLSFMGSAAAFSSVGSVSGKGALTISGVRLDVAEIPSWPVVVGDEIGTLADSAMVSFDDGTRLLIDRSSLVRIEKRGNKLSAVVISGTADFILGERSELQIFAKDDLVSRSGKRSGTASAAGKQTKRTQEGEDRVKKWNETNSSQKSTKSVSPYDPK